MSGHVYGVAFLEGRFIMVYNPKRKGWEMPGGKIEEGESEIEAMKREFREEVGREFTPLSRTSWEGTGVYLGEVGPEVASAELEWRAFDELPQPLSFPLVEYQSLIAWARQEMERLGQNRPAT